MACSPSKKKLYKNAIVLDLNWFFYSIFILHMYQKSDVNLQLLFFFKYKNKNMTQGLQTHQWLCEVMHSQSDALNWMLTSASLHDPNDSTQVMMFIG